MIIGVGEHYNAKCAMNFGTHNGIFHCDEVVGIAILEIAYINTDAYVVRTRNVDELNKLNIVIDIGGGMFDHHISGFNVCRFTGEKYASAGLVWKEFANEVIKNVMVEENISINDNEIKTVKEQIEDIVSYNQTHNYNVKFVIFPYPVGGWAAQSVPPSIEKKFEQLVSFPKEWAGGNEQTLPVISGIQDATFCHNGCFFVRAKTKESILEMCRIAMN